MGREARSPPVAGAPSGAVAGKSDIAPVATAPEFRTPGGSKSMRRAPWRSPGVALARRDDNARDPVVRAPASSKRNARKLDARSPATAAAGKTRGGGRPRTFTPNPANDDERERETSDARSPAPPAAAAAADDDAAAAHPSDDARRRASSPSAAELNAPHTDTFASVYEALISPSPARDGLGRAPRDGLVAPPPPARTPGSPLGGVPDAIDDAVPEPNDLVDPVAAAVRPSFGTREPPTLGPIAALPDEATDGGLGGDFEDDAGDDFYPSENALPSAEKAAEKAAPGGSSRPKTPAGVFGLGSPFSAPASSPAAAAGAALGGSLFTPAHGVADLTPLAPHAMRGGDAAPTMTMGMHLPTPTMDLTPLDRGAPTGAVPRMRAASVTPAGFPPVTTRGGKGSQPEEEEEENDDGEGVPSVPDDEEDDHARARPGSRRTSTFKTPGAAAPARTPGLPPRASAAKTPAARVSSPARGTPGWARDAKAWHAEQRRDMEAMMAKAKEATEADRAALALETARRKEEMERASRALEAQREEVRAATEKARETAELAAAERERMKAELRAQIEAQERTRRRLSEMAAAGARRTERAEEPPASRPRPAAALPDLAPVEDELRRCRAAIETRAAESERIAARQRELQREEADLHLRVVELQRYLLRVVADPAASATAPPAPSRAVADAARREQGAGGAANPGGLPPGAAPPPVAAVGSFDEDGFLVMDLTGSAAVNAATPLDAARNGVYATAASVEGPARGVAAFAAPAPETIRGAGARETLECAESAPVPSEDVTASERIASYRRPSQTIELRKRVVAAKFLGGSTGGSPDGSESSSPAGMLLTATSDGCLRLFPPGARRAAALIRGPRDGVVAADAAGAEAFVVSGGGGGGGPGAVFRYDLASGRELGALLASSAASAGDVGSFGQPGWDPAPRRLACVAAPVGGSRLVVAAGEGGEVFAWDPRAAPRGSRRRDTTSDGGVAATCGTAPSLVFRVPGAARIDALSLAGDGTSLAVVASNGARVFDLRFLLGEDSIDGFSGKQQQQPGGGRPARLVDRDDPGTRWVACAHAGGGGEILTLAASGDACAWALKPGVSGGAAAFGGYEMTRAVRDAAGDVRSRGDVAFAANTRPSSSAAVLAAGSGTAGSLALVAAGDRGERVRCFDHRSGAVVAEWGAAGELEGGAGFGGAHRWGHGLGGCVEYAPVTAACWGFGDAGGAFGEAAFAAATAEGVVRVYGPEGERA